MIDLTKPAITAAEVRRTDHPLYNAYTKFRGANPDTIRQARRFLADTPWARAKKG